MKLIIEILFMSFVVCCNEIRKHRCDALSILAIALLQGAPALPLIMRA